MAGIFGGGKKNSNNVPKYTGIDLQTSAQGMCIPIGWGKFRCSTNLMWYGRFIAWAQKQKAGKGGGGGQISSYLYFTAIMMGLCEGEVASIPRVWASKEKTTLAKLNLALFHGTQSQPPWAFLTSNYPSQALAYAGTAFLVSELYTLGSSPALPSHTFEIVGNLSGSEPSGSGVDANPRDIATDFLTNPYYGLGFPSGSLGNWTQWDTYCQATGIFFSPFLNQQEQALSTLQRWADLSNTWMFWTGEFLKAVPLGTSTITANGTTYTPNIAPIYDITLDDFQGMSDASSVTVTRKDMADCYNQLQLDILDRDVEYNNVPVLWTDQSLIDQFGRSPANVMQANDICYRPVAEYVVALIGKRAAYIRNTYKFTLDYTFVLLEPGDIVTLTEPNLGLNRFPVRIRSIEETEEMLLQVEAEEFPDGIGQSTAFAAEDWGGTSGVNTGVDPGDVNEPGIIEPDSSATGGVPQIWVGLSGGEYWGGADIYISFDGGTTYSLIGTLSAPSTQGVLTAALPDASGTDSVNTLSVDLAISNSTIPATATHADADALRTLCLVGDELVAYGTAAPGMTSTEFDLTYLPRGVYGSPHSLHASGALFTRLDPETTFKYALPLQYVGATVYLKFVSFNVFNQSYQDIADVTAYPYTTSGAGYYIAPPTSPSLSFSTVIQDNGTAFLTGSLSWTASAGPSLGSYELQISTDGGSTWGAGVNVGGGITSYTVSPALASTNYQFRVRAISQSGIGISTWVISSVVNSGAVITTVPSAPTGLTATAGPSSASVEWNTSSDATIQRYEVWRAAGTGAFGTAVLVQNNGTSTSWMDTTTAPLTQYTYYIVAINAAGSSSPSTGATVTTLDIGAGQPYDVPMSYIGSPPANTTFYRVAVPRPVSFSSVTNWQLKCRLAMTNIYQVTVLKNGSTWATGTIAAGATTGTWSFSSTSYATGDILQIDGPAYIDPTGVDLSITLSGDR